VGSTPTLTLMTIAKLAVGQLVRIEFLDHCEDGTQPIVITVTGEVMRLTPRSHVVIRCWALDKNMYDPINDKVFTILLSTVTHIDRLKVV